MKTIRFECDDIVVTYKEPSQEQKTAIAAQIAEFTRTGNPIVGHQSVFSLILACLASIEGLTPEGTRGCIKLDNDEEAYRAALEISQMDNAHN